MMTSFILFGYFGPETVLPVTSIVATIAGFAMMFGRHIFAADHELRPPHPDREVQEERPRSEHAYRGPHHSRSGEPDRVAAGEAESYDQSAA